MPGYVVDPNTQISLPGGGQVSASFLANQGVPGYSIDPVSGSVIAPSDATAVGYGGSLYGVAEHPEWFPQQQAKKPDDDKDPQKAANAQAHLQSILDDYGLGSLAGWAYGLLTQGYDDTYILQELRKRPEFNDRFPGIAARREAGLPPISPGEYVSLERQYDQATHAAGINGFFDRKDLYTKWISGDVSPNEVAQRAQNAYQAALGEPLDVRAELHRMYGTDAAGVATAYFLDPKNTLGEAQRRLTAGEIGGGASRSGFGLLTRDEAEMLAAQGVSGNQAQKGFGQLAGESQLFNPLVGNAGEQTIGREQQFAAEFSDNATAQRAIQSQAEERLAQFSGARGSLGKTGVSGLGDATT